MKMYEVGGCVRDEILGVPSKDIDFSVVLEQHEAMNVENYITINPFEFMVMRLKAMGFKIFLETPEFLTVRAQFPKEDRYYGEGPLTGMGYMRRQTADFVLARKEGSYTDGRRPDEVIPGALADDLARRDFTMNAIAKDENGDYIDPFNGREDISRRIIRAVGDPFERLTEDALRALRAARFAVTKGFAIEQNLGDVMECDEVLDAIVNKISDERIQQELSKMFRYSTRGSGHILFNHYPLLGEAAFTGGVSLDATMKTKGRGK